MVIPEELKSGYYRYPCIPGFIEAQLTTAKTQMQPRCRTPDPRRKRRWQIYTMGYYSVIRKNEFMSFAGKCR